MQIKFSKNRERDKSIVATNPNSEKDTFRIIIEASVDVKEGETIAVSVKPNKCFVFDKLTEKRIQQYGRRKEEY